MTLQLQFSLTHGKQYTNLKTIHHWQVFLYEWLLNSMAK